LETLSPETAFRLQPRPLHTTYRSLPTCLGLQGMCRRLRLTAFILLKARLSRLQQRACENVFKIAKPRHTEAAKIYFNDSLALIHVAVYTRGECVISSLVINNYVMRSVIDHVNALS
jgi:hypothetical protein